MNGTLQELTNLYIYKKNKKAVCQVHFKGRVYPYETVRVDELLGDILELCMKNLKNKTSGRVDISENLSADDIGHMITDDNEIYLEVARVIVECNGIEDFHDFLEDEFGLEKTNIITDVIEFFETIDEKCIRLTSKMLQNFLFKYGRYVACCDKRYPINNAYLVS